MLTIFFGMRDTKYMNIIDHFFPDSTAIWQFTNIKLATLLVCINTSPFTTQLSCQKKFKPRNRREHKDGNRDVFKIQSNN